MAEARRKTTLEERKEIVDYCINHNRNYKNTAAKFDVSYSQVYSWVKNMTSGSPGKLILTFAIPLMLGNIFQQLYTIADTMIVGRVIGVEALAAVGAADWLVFGSYIFCMCTDLQSRDWEIPGFLLSVELLSFA